MLQEIKGTIKNLAKVEELLELGWTVDPEQEINPGQLNNPEQEINPGQLNNEAGNMWYDCETDEFHFV